MVQSCWPRIKHSASDTVTSYLIYHMPVTIFRLSDQDVLIMETPSQGQPSAKLQGHKVSPMQKCKTCSSSTVLQRLNAKAVSPLDFDDIKPWSRK